MTPEAWWNERLKDKKTYEFFVENLGDDTEHNDSYSRTMVGLDPRVKRLNGMCLTLICFLSASL